MSGALARLKLGGHVKPVRVMKAMDLEDQHLLGKSAAAVVVPTKKHKTVTVHPPRIGGCRYTGDGSGICFYSVLGYDQTNPIRTIPERDRARLIVVIVVSLAIIAFYTALICANAYTLFSGIPTISLLLSTQPLLSPVLVVLIGFYTCGILAINLLYSSSSHVTNDPAQLAAILDVEKKRWFSHKWIPFIEKASLPLYFLYVSMVQLILVVTVIRYPTAHDVIAVFGISVALLVQFLRWLKRYIIWRLFREVHGPPTPNSIGQLAGVAVVSSKEKGIQNLETIFGTARYQNILIANLFIIFLCVALGITFIVLMWTIYWAETLTNYVSLFEYVLYGLVIALDGFRILDIWCPSDLL